jgi:hypothetical protein
MEIYHECEDIQSEFGVEFRCPKCPRRVAITKDGKFIVLKRGDQSIRHRGFAFIPVEDRDVAHRSGADNDTKR